MIALTTRVAFNRNKTLSLVVISFRAHLTEIALYMAITVAQMQMRDKSAWHVMMTTPAIPHTTSVKLKQKNNVAPVQICATLLARVLTIALQTGLATQKKELVS
jgi:hypothetical protein